MVDDLYQDVRYALRSLRSSYGFAAVAILSLALGIGANTAIFSLIDAVMLRSLPVSHPEQLLQVGHGDGLFEWFFTNPLWESLRNQQQVFSGVFAFGPWRFNLSQSGEAHRVQGAWVSGEYFTTLGVHPALGRILAQADDQPGCRAVAVLGYSFWQSEYGARRDVLGQSISLDGHPFEIVGVVQPGFSGVEVGKASDILVPLCSERVAQGRQSLLADRKTYWLRVIGRPKPGLDAQHVTAGLKVIAPQVFAAAFPTGVNPGDLRSYAESTFETSRAGNGLSSVRTQYRTALLVLMGVVGLVLLIACSNVANLLLSRAEVRQHEIAIRMALGAGRRRLMRQLLTESLLLSLSGAGLGILFARWSSRVLMSFLQRSGSVAFPSVFLHLAIDLRVLIFTTGIAVGTGLLFGIAPAWRGTRANPQAAMNTNSRGIVEGHSRFGLGKALVIFQIALSLILAAGAGLMAGTFRNLASVDMGFDPNHVLLIIADLSKMAGSDGQLYSALEEIRERLAAMPGVLSASFSDVTPMSGTAIFPQLEVKGFVPKSREDSTAWTTTVSRKYFKSLGTPLLAGRDFDEHDVKGAPLVAIVNEAMAKHFFGGGSPIGHYFRTSFIESRQPVQVIGVVRTSHRCGQRCEVPQSSGKTTDHLLHFGGADTAF